LLHSISVVELDKSILDHCQPSTIPLKMASAIEKPHDTSSEEKTLDTEQLETAKPIHTIENLPDPDAGLSEEERLAHVHSLPLSPSLPVTNKPPRTRLSSANSTSSSYPGSPSCT
jgi:hypothetical protein